MRFVNKGHEFDQIGKKMASKTFSISMCGTDDFALRFYEKYSQEFKINKIYGSQNESFNANLLTNMNDIPLYSAIADMIVITLRRNKNAKQIALKLESLGYIENITYFYARNFEEIYQAYVKSSKYLRYAELMITEKCMLSCKNCCLFIPYYIEPEHMHVEDAIANIDAFFKQIDYTFHFRLLGGEPLLHPGLSEIVNHVGNRYASKIDYFDIATNAMILPKPELLEYAKKYQIVFSISDYSNTKKTRIDDFISLLNKNEIRYQKDDNNSWLDLGFFNWQKRGSDEEAVHKFDRCGNLWRTIYDEKLYYCNIASSASRAHLFKDYEANYLDLRHPINPIEMLEFNWGFSDEGCEHLCNFCDGYSTQINNNIIPKAVQIERDGAAEFSKAFRENYLGDFL